jgi:hypothetical protein
LALEQQHQQAALLEQLETLADKLLLAQLLATVAVVVHYHMLAIIQIHLSVETALQAVAVVVAVELLPPLAVQQEQAALVVLGEVMVPLVALVVLQLALLLAEILQH